MKKNLNYYFISLLIVLGIGFSQNVLANIGGGNKDYYSKVTASASPSGAGTVYVNFKTKAKGSSASAESGADNQSAAPTHTYYLYADVNDGYKWSTWATGSNCKALNNATTQNGASVTVEAGTSTKNATVTAKFNQVTVNSVSGDNNINPTSRTEDYSGTIMFATSYGDAKTDFNEPSFTSTSGTGTFTMTNWTFSENTATVDYTFNGNGKRGDNSGTLTFSSKSNSSKSITITANYPAITIAEGEAAEILPSTPTTPTQGTATFAVTGATADDDFATPTISDAVEGDTWTVDGFTYADNVVMVNYTFTGNGDLDTHTAKLTLSEAEGGSNASNWVTLSALVEEVATQDASVTDNGVTTKYDTWAQAMAAANASSNNPTIKLLRDVSGISASQSITKSMTIDLNRYTLSGTADKLLNINGTDITVTITDSKNGGTIAMTTSTKTKASTVYVTKGSLILNNATIEATNNYGTASSDARAIAVWVDVNGTFVMNSGELKGTTAQDYAYGLYSYGNATINGGTLTVTSASKPRGICINQGATTINGGEINAISTIGTEAVGIYMYTANSKYGTLTTTGGIINVSSATTTAYGIYPYYAGNTITASDLTINVVAKHTTAYGVYMPAASTTSLTNCTINVEGKGANLTAANTVNAMGVYANKTGGVVTLDNTTIVAQVTKPSYGKYAYGVNTVAGVTTTIQNNCSITATSDYQYAYGVNNAGSPLKIENSTIISETKGAAYAYGVYSTGATNVLTGNTINATSGTTYGYGVLIEKASSVNTINNNNIQVETKASSMASAATSTTYTYGVYLTKSGTLTMEGNTVYAECTKENAGRYVYGAKFDSGTLTANLRNNLITGVSAYQYGYGIYNCAKLTSENDEVLGKTMANSTVYGLFHANTNNACDVNIIGGIYSAQSVKSTTATGIYVNYGKLTATGTTINATTYGSTARGVYADNSLDTYTLAKYNADITLTNCTINATSETSSTAYGVVVASTARENNEGTWNALSDANKTKYEATYKMGTEAVAATATINNCTVTATSATITAYGLYIYSRPYQTSNLYSPGETILDVRPIVTINGGTYKGTTNGTTTAGGMYTGGNTTVTGGTFIGAPKTTTGYGIYVYDGNMTATGSTIQVSGTGTLYGVLANAALSTNNFVDGKKYEGHVDLTDVNVTVTATAADAFAVYANAATQTQDATSYSKLSASDKNTYKPENYVYGEWAAAGSATIHSGTFIVNSTSTGAYTLYSKGTVTSTNGTASATPIIAVEDGFFKSTGSSSFGEVKCANYGGMSLQGGYYIQATNLSNYCASGYNAYILEEGDAFNQGYRCQVADKLPAGSAICKVINGSTQVRFNDLESALQYTNESSNNMTIVMLNDYTLPAGDYTVRKGVTLLIPFDDEYSCYTTEPMILHGWRKEDNSGKAASVTDPSADQSFVYRTLTLASGAQLNIEGIVSLSAKRWCVINSGCEKDSEYGPVVRWGNAQPSGSNRIYKGFGLINMENNSSIQVKSGGKLYCWGRIRGEGAIIAKSGAEVRECYVYTDWRNNDYFATYAQKTRCFPQNQYYIQDIQVPITYESGATCNLIGALYYSSGTQAQKGTMNFVGTSNCFIELPTGATMTKKYVASEDRLYIDMENGASFNNFNLNYSSWKVGTSSHIFTITNNWTVNVNSGTTNMTYDLAWAPGSVLNIKQGAAVTMLEGMSMYVYDHDDWGDFAAGRRIQPLMKPSQEASYGVTVKARTYDADCPDAEFIVDGTLTVTGGQNIVMNSTASGCTFDNSNKGIFQSGLYTTEAGANIHGTGTIQYLKGCGDQTKTQQLNLTTDWNTNTAESNIKYYSYTPISRFGTGMARPDITPAQLKNADDSYTATAGVSGMSTFKYFSEDEKWKQAWKVTFMNEDEEFASAYYAEGDVITSPTEQPQKEGHTFKGWSKISEPMGTTDIISEAQWEQIVVVTTIEVTPTTVITDNSETPITESTYVINEQVQAEVVKVDEGAAIEIAENVSVETQTLALSTTPSAIDAEQGKVGSSSQIKGNGTITAQNIFIDITMDPSGTLDASKYYAFAVPFAVNVDGGVQQFKNNEWEDCIHDTHYRAYTYNGANRAANGKGSNWTLVDNNGTFHPGTFYLVEFAPGSGNVYRFTKGGGNLNNAANIDLAEFASANTTDKGWNGIANNALQNVTISLSNTTGVAQVFDPAQNAFVTVDLVNTQFAIGTPLFVQTDGAGTAINSAVAQPTSAPARMLAQPQTETLGNYTVRIAAENANKMADQLFISASEDAENNYVIGKDLVKMFMGNATTAQLWVNNYDKKLSMHQAILTNGSAEASLTLYASKVGDYKIYLKDTPEDAIIYLLEDGNVIANLNDGAYSVALTKGENTQYGLRINARTKSDVVTSINNAIATKSIKKILLQGNVYIVRDGKLFNTLGQFVK